MARLLQLYSLLSLAAVSFGITVHDSANDISYQGTNATLYGANIESYQGIPFAESGSGSRRFTRPVAKEVSRGSIIDATRPGAACPQQKVPFEGFPFFSNVTNVSEDCLTLRVDRIGGIAETGRKLPVMVFIYGGGMSIGQAYDQLYSPQGLLLSAANEKNPVIYVAMNYRVNIFGYASSEALSEEGNTNMGLLDQYVALEWIRDHISAFGGDPDNVTIFGESDGATSVGMQLTAYGGKKDCLFRRAIGESGGVGTDTGVASNYSAVNTQAVAAILGCAKDDSKATLQCMREVPLDKLLNATLEQEFKVDPVAGLDVFIPTVDKDFLPDAPSKLIRSGRFHKNVDAIFGWNLNDASIFTTPTIKDEAGVIKELQNAIPALSKESTARLLSLYPADDFQDANNASASYYRAARIKRDFGYTCPALLTSKAIEHYSHSRAYLYQLEQTPLARALKFLNQSYSGVPHFSDIFYVFNEASVLLDDGAMELDVKLASAVSAAWARFAATGDPSVRSQDSLGAWFRALAWPFTVNVNSWDAFNVYRIGGEHQGNELLARFTHADGLKGLVEQCEFLTSPEFFRELET